MLIPDRRRHVLAHVRRHGSARVSQLATELGVSEWTVRRDLDELAGSGSLVRTRGGAMVGRESTGPPRPAFAEGRIDAKRAIAATAASLLPERGTIMLLGGSTTAELLPHLQRTSLTVVTNGLDIAQGLKHATDVTVVLLGGYLHREQMTLLGPMTAAAMADLHVDLIVGGAHGVDATTGVTGAKIIQAGYHRTMLGHGDRLMVLADSSKLGRRGPTLLAATDRLDTLVTDSDADPTLVRELRNAGPDVVVAPS